MPGLHTFRITKDGLHVYPRIPQRIERIERAALPQRLSSGIPGLDAMMDGGIPAGDGVLVGGPSGAGKTVLSTQFIVEGARHGEPGVIAIFEEHSQDYLRRAKSFGFDLEELIRQDRLRVIYPHPLDLSVDETVQEIRDAVEQVKARRVVIDSLSGFELALAPTFRTDYRESVYRLVGALTGAGITVLMTVETTESFTSMQFSTHQVSFLADDIIFQRYVEIAGELQKVITVIKMRGSTHSRDLKEYRITDHGMEIGRTLREYRDIITGPAELRISALEILYPALIVREMTVLQTLIALKEATIPALAQATGFTRPVLKDALDRLVALNYVVKTVNAEGQTVYQPVARIPEP